MVYFIGAGAGDPGLLTIKGKKIIDSCDIIIYAGSLVNKDLFTDIKKGAKLISSASLTLEEVLEIIYTADKKGLHIARVHTGDPSMYSAIREQMVALEHKNIEYEVIPRGKLCVCRCGGIKKRIYPSGSYTDLDSYKNGG